jgi:drug/metabolite transporter (DMT)-like permease
LEKESLLKLLAAFAAVYIIWGSTYLGIRFAIETIPPFLMAAFRFLVAGSILYLYSSPRSEEKLTRENIIPASIVGLLLLLGGNGGVVWAEQYISSGMTALLVSTVPVWVVAINFFFTKEKKNSFKNMVGVVLGFLGIFFLVSPEQIISGGSVDTAGTIVLLGATLSWSIGSVYSKYAVLPKSSLLSTSVQMLAGGTGLLLTSFLFGEWSSFDPSGISLLSALSFLYLLIFGSLIAFSAYVWLLKKAGPSKATTYAYVNPVVAVFLGWLLAGESVTLKVIISAVIIIAAVVIILTDFSKLKRKQAHVKAGEPA